MPCSYLIHALRWLSGVALGLFTWLGLASGQIRTDGSVGPALTLTGPNFAIGANLGKQVGGNLFHSFSSFNVATGQAATFSGPPSVGNIIGRVTGGRTSQVDGQIASTVPGANLFLLNPSGWVFGSHATLNVQGSFHVSTADSLSFADGTRISTGTPTQSSFTVAQPAAFGFLRARSGAINVAGSALATPAGKDLSIVGGPVQIVGGQITAPAGRLHIASAAGPGDIGLNGADPLAQTVAAYGPVTLTGGTVADVGDPTGRWGGGMVQVRGGAVVVNGSAVRATNRSRQPGATVSMQADTLTIGPGGTITTSAGASGDAGAISIATAGPFIINGDGSTGLTGVRSTALTGTSGRAGGVSVISGGALTVTLGGQINNATYGTGSADPVSVTAPLITLDATGSVQASTISSQAMTGSSGAPGSVTVRANDIALRAEGQIASFGFGTGGSGFVDVRATGTLVADGTGNLSQPTGILSDVNVGSHGDAGGALVQANSLTLGNRGVISSSTFGVGNAGTVQVAGIGLASSLTIDGGNLSSQTGILADAQRGSSGAAGNVIVSADSIGLLHIGQISSSTFAGGNAGTVTVNASTLSADGGGRTDFSTGVFANAAAGSSGKAGSVAVTANDIDLQAQGVISSSTFSTGNAGTVTVKANTLSVDGSGSDLDTGVVANAYGGSSGNAGTVVVTTNVINLNPQGVISSSTSGTGNAGKVQVAGIGPASSLTIDGGELSGATGILSNSQNGSNGAAGNVTVSANSIRLFRTGEISSSTSGGRNAGTVMVTAGTLSADGGGNTDFATGIFANTSGSGVGKAGSVTVAANAISLRDHGVISSSTFGAGNAGTVTIATNKLSVDGSGTDLDTGVLAAAQDGSSGIAGSVTVAANALDLRDHGVISSSAYGPGAGGKVTVIETGVPSLVTIDGGNASLETGIFATARDSSSGPAGQILVSADTIRLSRTGEIDASSLGQRAAGTVDITARELVVDSAGRTDAATGIFADSGALVGSTQDGGAITLQANTLTLHPGGEISSDTAGGGAAGKVTVTGTGGHSMITIDGGSLAAGIFANSEAASSGPAGQVLVSADTIRLLSSGEITASSKGQGPAGTVNVTARALSADGTGRTDVSTGIFTNADDPMGSGAGGGITVSANTISLVNRGVISSGNFGNGTAGNVRVTGSGPNSVITIDGAGSDVGAATSNANETGIVAKAETKGSNGSSGKVTVSADTVLMYNTGQISTSSVSNGPAGMVDVTAHQIVANGFDRFDSSTGIFSLAETPGTDSTAGDVTVRANQIQLLSRGTITSDTSSNGKAGTVTVTGTGVRPTITIDGGVSNGGTDLGTGISSNTELGSGGPGGEITVSADTITLLRTGNISTVTSGLGRAGTISVTAREIMVNGEGRTEAPTGIFSDTYSLTARPNPGAPPNAGDLNVQADKITLLDTGVLSSRSLGVGQGGNLTITGNTQLLDLTASGNGAGVEALAGSPAGAGAGTIKIAAGTISLLDQGNITTSAVAGGGGNVLLTAQQLLRLDRGSITTSSFGGTSNGGDIGIGGRFVVLNHSTIQANADAGKGGDISITASQYFSSPDSLVEASSTIGINGTINILAPDTNVPGTLAALSDRLLSMPNIQRQGCSGAAQSERTSSLIVGSHGGLPRSGEGPQAALYFGLDQPLAARASSGETPMNDAPKMVDARDLFSACGRVNGGFETSHQGLFRFESSPRIQ